MKKKLVSVAVSAIILLLIYWKIDIGALGDVLARTRPGLLAIAIGMIGPLTLISAWRFAQLAPEGRAIGLLEATRLTLAASSLNMVLPSKAGDLAKAWFMRNRTSYGGPLALALVMFEKTTDMLALLVWCSFGLLLYPDKGPVFWLLFAMVASLLLSCTLLIGSRKFARWAIRLLGRFAPARLRESLHRLEESWDEMHSALWRNWRHPAWIISISTGLWLLHLIQIWLFILALGTWTPFVANLALAPLAILAGLLPITLAGIGARDAGLVYLYAPYLSAPAAAALGILCTSRYVLPALGGLPFLGRYLAGRPDAA